MKFELTYATMFDPPAEMDARFEAALDDVRAGLGANHLLHINGHDCPGAVSEARHSPIDQRLLLGHFSRASTAQAEQAVAAAHAAFPAWRAMPLVERLGKLRRVADLIEQRVFHIAAALALEVGKNRMESLGEAQETADFFKLYADDMERNNGFEHELPDDPLPDFPFAQPQRDAPVWRVGRDRPVQLSAGIGGRPGRCGIGHRQHGGVQDRE